MKKLVMTVILLGTLLGACKKKDKEYYDTKAEDCGSNSRFNGTWVVNTVPEKDTLLLYWNGSTFVINTITCNNITNYAHYINYSNGTSNVNVSKDDCSISGQGGYTMYQIQ